MSSPSGSLRAAGAPLAKTMMNSSNPNLTPLAENDLELLSAYLDNQLSVAERVGLERRLAAEPRLRSELEELRATATALRALEPVRPPRSFTLDPATAPRRRPGLWPFAWAMQMGSGLAGLALVLLATVQMLGGRPLPAAAPAPAAMATEAAVSIMEAPQAYGGAEAPAPMATGAPAADMRQSEATPAPASESMAAAEAAPTAAAAAAEATPKEPGAEQAGDSSAGAAGGVTGGPASNSPVGAAPPAADQMVAPSTQPNDTASADTIEPALGPAEAATPMAAAPWLTLAAGIALIGLAVGLNLASRRG